MAREASFWTAEMDAAAQALWRKGLSGREVARLIGAPSHSAVIGRMWRLGARRPAQIAATNQGAFAGIVRARAAADRAKAEDPRNPIKRKPPRYPGGPRMVSAPMPSPTAVPCAPRPWLAREERECAYPVAGEGDAVLSCCNTPTRGGYCEGHRAAMFRMPRGTFASVLTMEERRVVTV